MGNFTGKNLRGKDRAFLMGNFIDKNTEGKTGNS
jgi:hypothetical protein